MDDDMMGIDVRLRYSEAEKKSFLTEQSVLITGAGTLGTEIAKALLSNKYRQLAVNDVRILDHSEDALWRVEEALKPLNDSRVRYLLGDIRDRHRMRLAMRGTDVVIHTAALKHVRYTNDNPIDTIGTNTTAVAEMIQEAIGGRVTTFCNMSTDKACSPTNIYGESKRMSEFLTTWAWKISGKRFFSARSGNFIGSSGSVIERWKMQRPSGKITLTNKHMNRFFIKPDEVADYLVRMTMYNYDNHGCIVIPFCYSFNMGIMAKVVASNWKVQIEEIGAQEGEKIDELLANHEEASRTTQGIVEGWWIHPKPVENGQFGAMSTAFVPTCSRETTEIYLEGLI